MSQMLFFALIATLIACELMLQLPFWDTFRQMLDTASKSKHVIGSHSISDHWKEKVLLVYSRRIGLATATLLLMMLAMVVPFLFLGFILEGGFVALASFTLSPKFLFSATGFAIFYLFLRRKLR